MSTPPTKNDPLDEALAFFEAFRRLGFTPDEIFMGFWPTSEDATICNVYTVVQRGELKFTVNLGPADRPAKTLEAEWTAKTRWWNEHASSAERSAIYGKGYPQAHGFDLIMALQRAGFPVGMGAMNRAVLKTTEGMN